MKILVCLKIVSQLTFADSLGEDTDRFSSGQLGINPADLYALELALRLKDQREDVRVTVMSMAPESAEFFLRDALAMGADEAVLISDPRAAGSDTLVTARILSVAIRRLPPQDFILCGKKSLDSETGHIGPQLAMMLGLPFCTNAVSFSVEGKKLCAVRAQDNGMAEYTGSMPALLTICNGAGMIRGATIEGMRKSRQSEICRFDLTQLGIKEEKTGVHGSPTRIREIQRVDFHRGPHSETASIDEGVQELRLILERYGEKS